MKKKSATFSNDELATYSRQMLIKEWRGEKGQAALKRSTVLVIGAGGSGSALLFYLAAAGVGTIKICDGDKVEITNLNRQILHNPSRIGVNKAKSAKQTLEVLNPNIEIVAYEKNIDGKNFDGFASGSDIICCAADDRSKGRTYEMINEYSFRHQVPVSWAGGYYVGGFAAFMLPPTTPCMSCYLHSNNESIKAIRDGRIDLPDDAGAPADGPNPIVGAAAGIAGSIQALETIKYLVGFGKNLLGRFLLFQMRDDIVFNQYELEAIRRSDCEYCGANIPSSDRRGR